jgi:hypothetical protein
LAPQARKILARMGRRRCRAFLNSRGDLGSANAALRLSVVAAALWLKCQARKVIFVSAALPRCAALRPGWVRAPPPSAERGGRAPGLRPRCGVDGRPARGNFGFWVLWDTPRRPQLGLSQLRGPPSRPRRCLQFKTPCAL